MKAKCVYDDCMLEIVSDLKVKSSKKRVRALWKPREIMAQYSTGFKICPVF